MKEGRSLFYWTHRSSLFLPECVSLGDPTRQCLAKRHQGSCDPETSTFQDHVVGRWMSAAPVYTVVKRQALPIAHLLIPEKFGCEMEFEEMEISVKLEKQIREQVCTHVGQFCWSLYYPPTTLPQITALDMVTLLSATKTDLLWKC